MQKTPWVIVGILTSAFLVAAATPTQQDETTKELREIKAILTRMASITERESHLKLYPGHVYASPQCDFADGCAARDVIDFWLGTLKSVKEASRLGDVLSNLEKHMTTLEKAKIRARIEELEKK